MRKSNHVIGVVNFLTLLLSIPILGGGIWLSSRANNTDCLKFLQWPLIGIGACIMAVSLTGIAGACYRNTALMLLYLWAMFFIIAALLCFIVFAYAVTDKGGGRRANGRAYEDFYLKDYKGWLEERVADPGYWPKIGSCIRDSGICARTRRVVGGAPESADTFNLRKLTPTESGCCKPLTECGYTHVNETVWSSSGGVTGDNPDCRRWSNEQQQLCYACDSCKAGVLASLKKSWRKVSIINIVVLILLVLFYLVAIAAYRNNRSMDNDESHGDAAMTKFRPGRIHF